MRHTYTSHYFDRITQKVCRKHQHQESENIAEMILGCFKAGKSIPFFFTTVQVGTSLVEEVPLPWGCHRHGDTLSEMDG